METFWYRLIQVHLEKLPLNWRERERERERSVGGALYHMELI